MKVYQNKSNFTFSAVEYHVCDATEPSHDNPLATFTIGQQFRLELEFMAFETRSGLTTILRIGYGVRDTDCKERYPGLFMKSNTFKIHSYYCIKSATRNDVTEVVQNEWNTVIMESVLVGNDYYFLFQINGIIIRNEDNNGVLVREGMHLYLGDRFNNYAGVQVRKVKFGTSLVMWSEWTEFSSCSVSCSGHTSGSKSRTRSCQSPDTRAFATGCVGEDTEARACNTDLCPGQRKPCECKNGAVRCNSDCGRRKTCELISWFQDDEYDNKYECSHYSYTRCYAWGDPHVVTYDNAKTDVYGVAQYLLTAHDGTDKIPPFKVLMNTKQLRHVSAVEFMYFSFPTRSGEMIEFETDRYGGANFYMKETGWNKLYPQKNENFQYKKWGRRHWAKTWFGMEIYHDGLFYHLKTPGFYDSGTYGLCMNKNMDKTDDYAMKNGTLLPMPSQAGYKRTWQEYESATSWIVGSVDLRGCLQYGLGGKEITEELLAFDAGPDMSVNLDCDPAIKVQVEKECNDMFMADWLKECTDIIDPSQTIADCNVDYCMDQTLETKKDILSKFIDDCAKKVDPGTTAVCDWPVLSGLETPTCGANQIWKGCAGSCADVVECDEEDKECPDDEELVPLCVCASGYVMSDGACILQVTCPVGGAATEWGSWTTCSKTCGRGKKSRARVCLGPAVCTDPMAETIPCNTCGCNAETVLSFTTDSAYQIAHMLWQDDYSSFGEIHFTVDATKDIRITLSMSSVPGLSGTTKWEIVLGDAEGLKSHILEEGGTSTEIDHTLNDFNQVIKG